MPRRKPKGYKHTSRPSKRSESPVERARGLLQAPPTTAPTAQQLAAAERAVSDAEAAYMRAEKSLRTAHAGYRLIDQSAMLRLEQRKDKACKAWALTRATHAYLSSIVSGTVPVQ